MTYLSAENPMQGITMLREVLAVDPKNELALLNMGMLSIQSGQYDRAVEPLARIGEDKPESYSRPAVIGYCLDE